MAVAQSVSTGAESARGASQEAGDLPATQVYRRFCDIEEDGEGRLVSSKVRRPDDFNFAYDVIDEIARLEPGRLAMAWSNPEGERHDITFGELSRWSNRAANFLRGQGIGRGDRVMLVLRRNYQYWILALALTKLGAVFIPATFMLKGHDLDYRLRTSGATAIIATSAGDTAAQVDAVVEAGWLPVKRLLVNSAQFDFGVSRGTMADALLTGSTLSGPDKLFAAPVFREGWVDVNTGVRLASEDLARVETRADDPMLIYFTSGTSGDPKMVEHLADYALSHIASVKYWNGVDPDGLHLTVCDTGWAMTSVIKMYGQWALGAAIMVYDVDRFHPGELLRIMQDYRVTSFTAPVTVYRMLSQQNIDDYDLSSVQRYTAAGEPLNPDLFDFWKRHTGREIYEGYGQTEVPMLVCTLTGMQPKPGSMGRPFPFATVRTLRPDGTPCATGEAGEICVLCEPEKPCGVLNRYIDADEKNAEAFRDGWYHTHDMARMDDDGYFWFVARTDDVIKCSGYRISPFEVESVLLGHPAVREVAVTATPDSVRGMAVKATIVLADGYEPSDVLTTELQTWAKTHAAPYKYPRVIAYVPDLPRTTTGKIRCATIRNEDAQAADAGGAGRPARPSAGEDAGGVSA